MLRQYSVDGVIVASSTLPPQFSEAFKNAGIPVVHSFGRWSASPTVNVVGIDNVTGGRIAAEALIARGYRHVAFLGGPEQATSTIDRRAGFRHAVLAHPGITYSESFANAYSFEAGWAETMRLQQAGPLAEAYFCGDDLLAVGALDAIRAAGLSVPRDIGLIGLNGMEMSGWDMIGLTTIRQPLAQIIDAAIDLVTAAIDDPARPPEIRLFPCEVVERATLRAPATP